MADEAGARPHVIVHCRRPRDCALVGGLLAEIGAGWSPLGSFEELGRLLERDRVDLALADGEAHPHRLDGLVRGLRAHARDGHPPLILIARPRRLPASIRGVAHRFHVRVVPRPYAREHLAEAIREALAIREGQCGQRDLRCRLREAEAEIERLRREAEADARRRTQLLAAISHNLRTPINEIALFCQVTQQARPSGDWPPDVERLAMGLQSSVADLRELIDDLVDIASFDLGSLSPHESAFRLGPFLDRTLAPFVAAARRKGLDFRVEVEPADPAVRTDPDMLTRILSNLASNAVKFTDRGEVRVSARVEPGAGLVLAVHDTGRGIPPEAHAGIFDEFAQLNNPARQRTKGTGLGLAICRRLVSALGGRIAMESEPGRGSTFTATLPGGAVVSPRISRDNGHVIPGSDPTPHPGPPPRGEREEDRLAPSGDLPPSPLVGEGRGGRTRAE